MSSLLYFCWVRTFVVFTAIVYVNACILGVLFAATVNAVVKSAVIAVVYHCCQWHSCCCCIALPLVVVVVFPSISLFCLPMYSKTLCYLVALPINFNPGRNRKSRSNSSFFAKQICSGHKAPRPIILHA